MFAIIYFACVLLVLLTRHVNVWIPLTAGVMMRVLTLNGLGAAAGLSSALSAAAAKRDNAQTNKSHVVIDFTRKYVNQY